MPRMAPGTATSTRIHGTINGALEPTVERKRGPISKGQNLRHEHGSEALRRIDPIISIEETRPGEAAGAAAVRSRRHVDHVAKAPSQRDARKEIDVVRERGIRRLQNTCADLILAHER